MIIIIERNVFENFRKISTILSDSEELRNHKAKKNPRHREKSVWCDVYPTATQPPPSPHTPLPVSISRIVQSDTVAETALFDRSFKSFRFWRFYFCILLNFYVDIDVYVE